MAITMTVNEGSYVALFAIIITLEAHLEATGIAAARKDLEGHLELVKPSARPKEPNGPGVAVPLPPEEIMEDYREQIRGFLAEHLQVVG